LTTALVELRNDEPESYARQEISLEDVKQFERKYNEWTQCVQPEERSWEFFAAIHGLITLVGVYYAKVDYAKHKKMPHILRQTCHCCPGKSALRSPRTLPVRPRQSCHLMVEAWGRARRGAYPSGMRPLAAPSGAAPVG